jgi:UDP-N-acetylglucosamine 2-epimerase (non-hydrolysing)
MDKIFFDELGLPEIKYNLDVGSGTHAEQTGKIMTGIEKILIKDKPDLIMVQGDTNTVLSGALAASKLHIKIGHVEAGLRSYDRRMPEEINRVITDHISDYLYTPTLKAKQNLLKEGINENKIFVTGNTVVDAVFQNVELSKKRVSILKDLNLKTKGYFLVTLHRQENVDTKERLINISKGLELLYKEFSLPIIFPMHPRTEKMVKTFGCKLEGIVVIKPLGFLEFLQLEANSKLVLTDSGGVQEETCILGVPCITLRDNTERPETIEAGSNTLVETDPIKILKTTKNVLITNSTWVNPFGDGKAAAHIIESARGSF